MLLRKIFIILVAFGLMLLFVYNYFSSLQKFYEVSKNYAYVRPLKLNRYINPTAKTKLSKTNNESEIWLDYCNLTDIDPWDSTIMKFIKPEKDHMLDCVPQIFQHSKLIDGQLFIYSKRSYFSSKINCQMRCLFPKGDWNITFGKWMTVINGTKPECDVIEVECDKNNYKFLHAQIYRNTSSFPPLNVPKPPEKFDVHVIILDSVSQTQFIRSMPKTIHMLQKYYDAVPFEHLNKVGSNSYPNGFAFLFGKTYEAIPKSPLSRGYTNDFPGKTSDQICKMPLDEEQFIGFRYQDAGYVTMMAEDWSYGFVYDPNCPGFTKTPLNHYMKPFQLQEFTDAYENIMRKKSCHEDHHYLFNYLKDFLRAYPDKLKFTISWMIHLAHNQPNSLSSSDDYFYNFFNDTKKDFENSFLFVMGDHGLRFGNIRETKNGEMEDNNPALFISVPKPLRSNATLMNQLKMNSKELISHYDIYATLNKLPKNPRILNPILHGSSLFHPLPYPRTCDSLRIPFEYCKCRAKRTLLSKSNEIGIPAAKLMVEQMNFNLSTSNQTLKFCSELILDESTEVTVEDYGSQHNVTIYKITFSTLPGNGIFWGFISYDSVDKKFEILSSIFPRLNSYASQTKCITPSPLISYCYCMDQYISVDNHNIN